MNFYEEAIEGKHRLQVELVRCQRVVNEIGRMKPVAEMSTTDLTLQTLYRYDIAALEDADAYFWSPQVTHLALASGQQLPDTVAYDTSWLIGKAGYWWFGRSSPLIGISHDNERKYVNALLWKRNPNGSVTVQTFYLDGAIQRSLGSLTWDEGETLANAMQSAEDVQNVITRTPDLALHDLIRRLASNLTTLAGELVEVTEKAIEKHQEADALAKQIGEPLKDGYDINKLEEDLSASRQLVVTEQEREKRHNAEYQERLAEWITASKHALMTFACGCLWLQQKIVVTEPASLERAARRRLERANIETKCLVVRLRRREYAHVVDNDKQPVDWAYRWAVRGHWRNQPTNKGIKLIYIHPFIKGPEDKPLKVDIERVFAVTQ